MNEIVTLRSVYAGYGDEVILRDVNLTVCGNDFLGIIGPNGGGKTTLLRVMMGLLKPMRGTVTIHAGNEGRSVFGYLPQVNRIDKKFPILVKDVVLSGLMEEDKMVQFPRRNERERIREMLERAGVYALRNKVIGELSGGQMQRVMLARAVISNPRLLLLDEPNTFVDSSFEKDLYEFLRELNSQIAIIVISHDLGMISSYVKTIACVNRGLHYHHSNVITEELLATYNCPIDLIAHGNLPHRVLGDHKD